MRKFSIIVPVYNSEKYIEKCINSIIVQTYKDFELIIIDDGSQDNSGNICEEYSSKDSRIKVIHQKNSGVSNARNRGIQEASGDYILFVDSDDWIKNDSLEKINYKIEKSDTDLVIYKIMSNKTNKKKCLKTNGKEEFLIGLRKIIINEIINSPVNKTYSAEIIKKKKIRFKENIDIAEDLLFNIMYFSNINSFELINEELYYYNQENIGSLTKKYNSKKYKQLMEVDDEIEKILLKYKNKQISNSVKYIRIKNIFSCIIDFTGKNCNLTLSEKKLLIKKMQNDNRIKIIIDNGLKPFFYSLVYNIIRFPSLLLYLTRFKNI